MLDKNPAERPTIDEVLKVIMKIIDDGANDTNVPTIRKYIKKSETRIMILISLKD